MQNSQLEHIQQVLWNHLIHGSQCALINKVYWFIGIKFHGQLVCFHIKTTSMSFHYFVCYEFVGTYNDP